MFNNKYAKIISHQKKPFKFLLSRVLMRSGICRFFKVKQNGYYLRFYPSALSATLWIYPDDRQSEESFFRSYLKKGDKVIDVGANIGSLTVLASLIVGSQGKVYSIEPHPETYQYLMGNLRLNRLLNVETFNYAIGETSKSIVFSDKSDDSNNQVMADGKGIPISMKKLDELAIDEQEINLLKIDVEGYEKFVFDGGYRIVNQVECIFFESYETHFVKFGYSTSDIIKFLVDRGFRCFKLVDKLTIQEVSVSYVSKICENLLAVKDISSFLQRTSFVRVEKL
ncbi:FkbM family methyltransferase [Coleofasciculus sp. FACHB-SPT36]|uniref:FkbM family methyltransferase n=1 Tax=Cyanophyceae TaxID=3028117 RepID=UPI00168B1BC0|nr:FkbM family methyltransferase [Coleofasciculus sp. FACHB-SPT36]MBD2538440.1 FkbM family methyltransferase [Coleofasciculus sp. FACHB-SPT36]